MGQLRDDGRTIPSPVMVVMTGESQLELEAMAEEMNMSPQDVVAYALQRLKQHQDVLMGRSKPEPAAEPKPAKSEARSEPPPPSAGAFTAW